LLRAAWDRTALPTVKVSIRAIALQWRLPERSSTAAQTYIEEERSKLAPQFMETILEHPDFMVTFVPQDHEVRRVHATDEVDRQFPQGWKDPYFADIHGEAGS
jgi:hypothetical protein